MKYFPHLTCFAAMLLTSGCISLDLRHREELPPLPSKGVAGEQMISTQRKMMAPQAAEIPPVSTLLNIKAQTNNVVLSWRTNGARNYVEQTISLTPPEWSGLVKSTRTNAGVCSVSIPRTNSMAFFRLLSVTNQTAAVSLQWNPHPDPDVTGFRLYYGTGTRNYTKMVDCGFVQSWTLTDAVAGRNNYFAATAYNGLGMESDYSTEAVYFAP